MSIKVGVIGVGIVSERHLLALNDKPEVKLAAIADPNKEILNRQARTYNVQKKWTDYRQILDDKEIDLVYICVPHYLHHQMAIESFAAGKHVICEKPLSMNAQEADQMIEAAQKSGRKFYIAENHRFLPEHIKTCQLLTSDVIGRPFMCISCFIGDETARMNDPHNWKGTLDKAGGGVIIDNGFHMIDTLRSFFGPVESVTAIARRLVIDAGNKEEDTALVTLSFQSNVLVELCLTFVARYNNFPPGYAGYGIRFDIYGTDGSLHLREDENNPLALITKSGQQLFTARNIFESLPPDTPLDMNHHLIDCLLNNTEPLVTVEDARQVMRVIDACYESVRTGKKVSLS